jgi:hypothetical protein
MCTNKIPFPPYDRHDEYTWWLPLNRTVARQFLWGPVFTQFKKFNITCTVVLPNIYIRFYAHSNHIYTLVNTYNFLKIIFDM